MTVGDHRPRVPAQDRRTPVDLDVDLDAHRPLGAPAAPGRSAVRRQHVTLPPQPESVPAGRHFLRLMLLEWGLREATETVELAASELLTNAVVHARTSFDVTIVAQDDLTVSVRDTGGSFPTHLEEWGTGVHAPDGDSEGGRGLLIVAAVADEWGTTSDGSATTVWFQVPLPS
jgi:anti-sigma regulatory factor (Ser/Thr protein kinase)